MGTGGNVIATERKGSGSAAWYLYNKDVRESTSSVINSAGELAKAYEYDAFGETTARAGESFWNEIGYTGQVYDESTGLYYYKARFYDPEDGRFVSQDTYRGEQMEPGTWHLYSYCVNDPVNSVDPSGHASKWVYSKKTKRFGGYSPDFGMQIWRVRVHLSVNYKKTTKKGKNKGKKTILNMNLSALGDEHQTVGNGSCWLSAVRIYHNNKVWKKINGSSSVVKQGNGQVVNKSTYVYTDKKINKNYAVGKKKIKVKATFSFLPPIGDAVTWGGPISTSVSFR